MLNIYNDPCDLLFTKMKDFPEIPFNSVYSTESDDFQFDLINFPSNFEIPNDDSNISFLYKHENILLEKEINKGDNKNNLEPHYDLDNANNNELIKINKKLKFISKKENLENYLKNNNKYTYRKDAYYKHFKSIFAKYLKDKANHLKNICFPHFSKNNFSSLAYKYTGNPKEKDNYNFLSFKIKDLLSYGKDERLKNRQYNNELLIKYIVKNEIISKDKKVYRDLIQFLDNTIENEMINFYKNKKEIEYMNKDLKCLFYDFHFKKETGISLLENNGFLNILSKQYKFNN